MKRERDLGPKPSATKSRAATKRSLANAPSSKASRISKSRSAKSALAASSARVPKTTSAPRAATTAATRSTKISTKKSAAAPSDAAKKKLAKGRKKRSSRGARAKEKLGLKPMKLDAAFRRHGFDEHRIATSMVGLADNLEKRETEPKLFLDLLKEGIKVLWTPPRPADRAAVTEGPVPVILVHNVPRPTRALAPAPAPNPPAPENILPS
jgi:hypothetical protein